MKSTLVTLIALRVRQNRMAEKLKEIIAEHPHRHFVGSEVIRDYGQAMFEELKSHHDGDPKISTLFRDTYGWAPTTADSMFLGRRLRKLEAEGDIELITASPGSRQVRWAKILLDRNNRPAP